MKTAVNENFFRTSLLVFNSIFLILSVSLIALAIAYTQELSVVKWYIGSDFISFPAVLLFLGSLSFIMSIAGCYSAKSKNKFFFIMFISTFICLLILELTVAIVGFINANSDIEDGTKSTMRNQITSRDPVEKSNFHEVEKLLGCCGIDGPKDYFNIAWQEEENVCCGFKNCLGHLRRNRSTIWFKSGCTMVVVREIQQIGKHVAVVTIVYSILQILEIVCIIFLLHILTNT